MKKKTIRLSEKAPLSVLAPVQTDKTGRVWEAVLIQAGTSKNRRYYSPKVLKAAVPLFEGLKAQAYQYGNTLPAYNHLPGSVDGLKQGFALNTVGFFKNARYGTFTTREGKTGEGILAEFHVLPSHAWLSENLKYAYDHNHENILGFSIDARGFGREGVVGGETVQIVEKIEAAASTDVVSVPAAGGRVLRLVAGMGDHNMRYLLSMLLKFRPSWAKLVQEADLGEDEQVLRILEAAYQSAHEVVQKTSVNDFEAMQGGARAMSTLNSAVTFVKAGKPEEATKILEPWVSQITESATNANANFLYPQVRQAAPAPVPVVVPAPVPAPVPVRESQDMGVALTAKFEKLEKELLRERNNNRLSRRLSESQLPALAQSRIAQRLNDREELSEAQINDAIREEQEYITALAPTPSPVTGLGGAYGAGQGARQTVVVGKEKLDKLRRGMDLMFAGDEFDKDGNRAFTGIKEAWAQFNPHKTSYDNREMTRWIFEAIALAFPKNMQNASSEPIDVYDKHKRFLKENWSQVCSQDLKEGVITSEFTVAFGDSMFKRMQSLYLNDPAANWRSIVSPSFTNLNDATRVYNIVRMGDIPVLPQVLERATYQELIENPTEANEKITPGKYGGVYTLSWESLLVDDLGYLRQIPTLLAKSSNRRIARLVFNVLESNATMNADSLALLHSSHSNLISGNPALGYSGIVSGVQLFRDQLSQDASEKLGLKPKWLLTGPKKEAAAWELCASDRKASTAEDSTLESFVRGMAIQPLMSVELGKTGTTDDYWWLLADPREAEVLVVGFLGGRSVPDIFVQGEQTPTAGSYFSQDVITFKVRLVVGATAVDYRGIAGSQA